MKLITVSLLGTDEQLMKLQKALALAGWKLKYQGHSGTWLGEPIYEITKEPPDEPEGSE